jgi:hypothetical protein
VPIVQRTEKAVEDDEGMAGSVFLVVKLHSERLLRQMRQGGNQFAAARSVNLGIVTRKSSPFWRCIR